MARRRITLTHERDLPMLLFLWRWKVATTKVLHARYFRDATLARAYKRLMDLEAAGFVISIVCPQAGGFAWGLERAGFHAIRDRLPALREEGFKSESVYHDLVSLALQLGDWVNGMPEGYAVVTEQQLRRYDVSSYPLWTPKSSLHRPDGYTLISGDEGDRVVALEVELSPKPPAAYRLRASFYAHQQSMITEVLWLIARASFAPHLKSHLADYDADIAESRHHVVSLPDFKERGWQSQIILGPRVGETISQFFAPEKGRRKAGERPETSPALLGLDGRKSYVRPPVCSSR